MRQPVLIYLALSFLAACGSTPTVHYYTLGSETAHHVRAPVNVTVERFRTTEALARRGIMVSASDFRVAYHGTEQWAEGLGGLVQRRLAAAFGPPVPGRRTLRLTGTVLACGEVARPDGRYARVELAVEVRDAATPDYEPPLFTKSYEVERAAPGEETSTVVQELAVGLDEIATKIAEDLRKLPE